MWGEHVDATNLLSRCAAAEWHFFWLPVTTLASCRLGSSTSNKLPPARPHCSSAFTPHGTYGVQHNPTRAVSVTSVCLILCVCVCVCVARSTWPRASCVAERLWSSASVNDITAAKPRLHHFRCQLLQRGIPAEPISPGGSISGVPLQADNAPGYCTREYDFEYLPPGVRSATPDEDERRGEL